MADENSGGDLLINTAKFLGKVTLAVVATAVFADDIGKGIQSLGEGSADGFWKSLADGLGGFLKGASDIAAMGLAYVTNHISSGLNPSDFQSLAQDGTKLGLTGVGANLLDGITGSEGYKLVTDNTGQAAVIALGGGAAAEVIGRWTQQVAHEHAVNVNINPAYKG